MKFKFQKYDLHEFTRMIAISLEFKSKSDTQLITQIV